ncbi:MAG: bifunctional isocitrate dehydrogenase kinase/phosphatase [Cyclobacteriaceae bacterium]|nr:bifunctional isocitrate dehydrogenase kinase/phosphatase [Cyclobacteriaceae bacterium]
MQSVETKEIVGQVWSILQQNFDDFLIQFNKDTDLAEERFIKRAWRQQRAGAIGRSETIRKFHELTFRQLSELGTVLDEQWDEALTLFEDHYAPTNNFCLAQSFALQAVYRLVPHRPELFFRMEVQATRSIFSHSIDVNGGEKLDGSFLELLEQLPFAGIILQKEDTAAKLARCFERITPAIATSMVFHRALFYRNKHAYLVGKVFFKDHDMPIVIPFVGNDEGIVADALLTTQDELKRVFAFSRSYFFVSSHLPEGSVEFLLSLMPSKSKSQLCLNLGYQDWGKCQVYRSLLQHIQHTREKFDFAPGIPGLVMIVFTLPTHDIVIKLVRDTPRPPKDTDLSEVLEKYRMVARHDRVGRLADAQYFPKLTLPVDSFGDALLNELHEEAPGSITIEGRWIYLTNVLIERKMVPLNLYLKGADAETNRPIVEDYGLAIKEMAMANLFPGDLLIKNFGVTQEKRVVFYDYDEMKPLTECRFAKLPPPRNEEEEFDRESWSGANDSTIYPEEWSRFLMPAGPMREMLTHAHKEIFESTFWDHWKDFHTNGNVVDVAPYSPNL